MAEHDLPPLLVAAAQLAGAARSAREAGVPADYLVGQLRGMARLLEAEALEVPNWALAPGGTA